jgi:hypothetical protein
MINGRTGGGDKYLNARRGHANGDVEHRLLYALRVIATLILFCRTLENEAVKAPIQLSSRSFREPWATYACLNHQKENEPPFQLNNDAFEPHRKLCSPSTRQRGEMKGRPFSANDMTLSNVAGCPLHRHISEWSSTLFRLIPCYALPIDMSARRNRDYSFSANVHGDNSRQESRASINCS